MILIKLSNQRGFTLVEAMIAGALTSLIFLSLIQIINSMNVSFRGTIQVSTINKIRSEAVRELGKRVSWVQTYNSNPNFTCLINNTSPCPDPAVNDAAGVAGGTIFQIYKVLPNGTPAIYLPYSATSGFNYQGVACSTYPSNACPIRLVMSWTLVGQGTGSYDSYYSASGYYPASYFATVGITIGDPYGYVATISSRIRVVGTFSFHNITGANKTVLNNTSLYSFELQKDVP